MRIDLRCRVRWCGNASAFVGGPWERFFFASTHAYVDTRRLWYWGSRGPASPFIIALQVAIFMTAELYIAVAVPENFEPLAFLPWGRAETECGMYRQPVSLWLALGAV